MGRVTIRHPSDSRLLLKQASGVRRSTDGKTSSGTARVDEASRLLSGTSGSLVFDVWREEFVIGLVTQRKEREMFADILTTLAVTDNGLDLDTLAKVEVVYAPLYELDLVLPAEWSITAALVQGEPANWRVVPRQAGVHQVRIPLKQRLEPGNEVSVLISAHRNLEKSATVDQPVEFDLPEVRLPQANVVDGSFLIQADDDFDLDPIEVRGLEPVNLKQEGERIGYRYQDTRFAGRLRISRKRPRISVQTMTFSRLDPNALRSYLRFTLEVQGGGLERVALTLPESAGDELRFVSVDRQYRITEQSAGAIADGRRTWDLQFDRRVKGQATFSVSVETARDEETPFRLPTLSVPAAERQSGQIAVEASAEQRLTVLTRAADGRRLSEVDPIDLPYGTYRPRERIVAAYRSALPGYEVTVSEQRFDRFSVPTAVCHQSAIQSVLSSTGRHPATGRVHAGRRRRAERAGRVTARGPAVGHSGRRQPDRKPPAGETRSWYRCRRHGSRRRGDD